MLHEANGIVKKEWSHYLTETELKNHKHLIWGYFANMYYF